MCCNKSKPLDLNLSICLDFAVVAISIIGFGDFCIASFLLYKLYFVPFLPAVSSLKQSLGVWVVQ